MSGEGARSIPPDAPAPEEPRSDTRQSRETPVAPNETVDRLLEQVAAPQPAPSGGALRVARVLSVTKGAALVEWRGGAQVPALLAPGVDASLIEQAAADREVVLVEEGTPPLVVGVLQTRPPREIRLKAGSVTLEGEREVLIRAGRAAIRLREDGDIEIVGSRISAASRGLFRLVGRILRLN